MKVEHVIEKQKDYGAPIFISLVLAVLVTLLMWGVVKLLEAMNVNPTVEIICFFSMLVVFIFFLARNQYIFEPLETEVIVHKKVDK